VIQFNAKIGSGTVLIEFLSNCLLNSAVKRYPGNCLLLTAFARGDYDVTLPGKACNIVAEIGILKIKMKGCLMNIVRTPRHRTIVLDA
jgi:hypothetical protein